MCVDIITQLINTSVINQLNLIKHFFNLSSCQKNQNNNISCRQNIRKNAKYENKWFEKK